MENSNRVIKFRAWDKENKKMIYDKENVFVINYGEKPGIFMEGLYTQDDGMNYYIDDDYWSNVIIGTCNGTIIKVKLFHRNKWINNWTDYLGVKWSYRMPITVSNGTDMDYEDFQTSTFVDKNYVSNAQIRVVKDIGQELLEVPCYIQDFKLVFRHFLLSI